MRAVVLGVNGLTWRAIADDLATAGWDVVGTGRDPARFPAGLRRVGVRFVRSDRFEPDHLAACLSDGADVVVDCLCYTAEHARSLMNHRASFGSAIVLSSKAVYVDSNGRHANSDDAPHFDAPVREDQPVLRPDFSGDYDSRAGYGANKVAAELTLLDSDVPVSIIRPSRVYGQGGSRPREWYVVRRLLDGRTRIPLAHHGRTGHHPTAAVNLARLVRKCAETPGRRVLNAADPGTPTAADIVEAVAVAAGIPVEIVGLPDDMPARLGWSPWASWPPFFLDTAAADGVGYRPVRTYAETVEAHVAALGALSAPEREQLDHDPYFDGAFDYSVDDDALARSPELTGLPESFRAGLLLTYQQTTYRGGGSHVGRAECLRLHHRRSRRFRSRAGQPLVGTSADVGAADRTGRQRLEPDVVHPEGVLLHPEVRFADQDLRGRALLDGLRRAVATRQCPRRLDGRQRDDVRPRPAGGLRRARRDHSLGASAVRGTGGPVGVSVPTGTDDETVRLFLDSAAGVGWTFARDLNAHDQQQIGFTPSTIKNGVRQSTANSFLWPARGRKNLTIAAGTTVGKLRFDGKRVVGVTARSGKRLVSYTARKEVIVSAGAVETPLLLERSGIGRGDVLAKAGVPLLVESPNVGERMIEQHGVAIQVRFKRDIGHTLALSSKVKQLSQGARYLLTRQGPVGTAGYDLMAHIKSSPGVSRPDIQMVSVPFGLDFSKGLDVAKEPGMYLMGYQIRPNTQSSIHISHAAPGANPVIHANYFEDDEDQRITGTVVEHLRSVTAQDPIASEIAFEEFPGPDVKTPDQVLDFARSPGITIYHAVGSAAMGPNDDDVVTPDLRVRGVDGLRVVDISVLPQQVSGNTAGPAMAIGWRAADLIRNA